MNRAAYSDQFLLFRSGSRVCALGITHVRETMRPLPLQRIAGAPALVLGIAVVRGTPCPVIDAARLLSEDTRACAQRDPAARFISLKLGERGVCLAVDAVLAVRRLSPQQLHQTPALLGDAADRHVSRIGTVDQELLMVLNAARMVPEAVWSAMQAATGHG